MKAYRLVMWLLFCSQSLLASSYWTHMPDSGSVQLTGLNTNQQSMLANHLNLSLIETQEWIDKLPQLLDSLACETLTTQSQPLPSYIDASYKLISYDGLLRWASDDKNKSAVWWLPWSLLPQLSELTRDMIDLEQHVHQPLLLNEQQLGIKGQFVIIGTGGITSPSYFALQLNSVERPELLWSAESTTRGFEDLKGTMAQPVLLSGLGSAAALSLLLPNTKATEQQTLIYKVDALTGSVQAKLQVKLAVAELSGALALYDQNMDSIDDTLLFASKTGQIWQVQIEEHQFYDLQLIADISGLELKDIQFIRALYAAVPVGGAGSDFHSRRSQWLILLSAMQQRGAVFVLLKHKVGEAAVFSDLVDRTTSDAFARDILTSQDWPQIQQKKGWYSQFNGRFTHLPLVAAGVLYLRLVLLEDEQLCRLDTASSSLIAMHLHHASAVYSRRILTLTNEAGAFVVKTNTEGGFALVEQNHQQVLIENLLEISPECANCSKVLQQDSFPRWQLMGTYQSEEGAYE